jgi:hypothetical protein
LVIGHVVTLVVGPGRSAVADVTLEQTIRALLASRASTATICPSDVARAVSPKDWRKQMEPVREAARRMVAAGEVEVTQGGRVVDPSTAKGPIRIRLRQSRFLEKTDDQRLC